MADTQEQTVTGGNFPTPRLVYEGMTAVRGEKEGTMILRVKENPKIDNLRNYPEDIVEKLRTLLVAGAQVYPDPRRKEFYDVANGSRMFYIHLSPQPARCGCSPLGSKPANKWPLRTTPRWLRPASETSYSLTSGLPAGGIYVALFA